MKSSWENDAATFGRGPCHSRDLEGDVGEVSLVGASGEATEIELTPCQAGPDLRGEFQRLAVHTMAFPSQPVIARLRILEGPLLTAPALRALGSANRL